jgi:homoserine dehydrogenase
MSQIMTRYYIRMGIADQPGVLAQVAYALGANNISIASAIQKETAPDQTAEIVIMTHPAREEAVQAAFADFKKLPVIKEVHNFVRVEV